MVSGHHRGDLIGAAAAERKRFAALFEYNTAGGKAKVRAGLSKHFYNHLFPNVVLLTFTKERILL